ncbi:RING finger protein 212B-like isoform X2 [Synchiropus splendidus]|uniref:RING finger protein 212B-like isoform X2 n=1 Tax=Synchiropus splendidus TaxID=270530 RepID=UPI00237E3A0C|nr:RING finger protein 212B-like isoform X2 [Synchiropus splendidus]
MEWFHCNQCKVKSRTKFAVSSCGHICCEACINPKQCTVCGANCSYLAITDKMRPEEKLYFKDPAKLFRSRLENIAQIVHFQQKQQERLIGHLKEKCGQLEQRLKDIADQGYRSLIWCLSFILKLIPLYVMIRQLKELRRENDDLKKQLSELRRETAELKKPLSLRRVSPGHFHSTGSQKITLPVAVTSPVTPHLRNGHVSGAEVSQEWYRERSLIATPGSASSHSSRSSFHEQGPVLEGTPTSFIAPARVQRHTPNPFHLQFVSGLSLHSPRC